ncbi:hypothetical protein [Streptomyces sp. NPDC087300]|uniref:hypothetical protein n=1 Tax=Streptomyces sp. NPDC087300 TaxID=3365780 RepID=UPI00380CAF61
MDTQDDQVGGEIDAWGADQLAASPEWAPEQYVHVRSCLEGDSVLEQLLTAGHGFDAGARGPPRTCERRADHAFGTHADG